MPAQYGPMEPSVILHRIVEFEAETALIGAASDVPGMHGPTTLYRELLRALDARGVFLGIEVTEDMPEPGVEPLKVAALKVAAPTIIGLCPGRHMHDFYLPLEPGASGICPECEERMVVYIQAGVVAPDDDIAPPLGGTPFGA